MSQPAIIPFAFNDNLVRIVLRDGEPWFVARDVCDVLGLAKHDTALQRLDPDEKGSHTVGTPGGPQSVSIISESGLYALAFSSRKPEARAFRKWVTSEVLPAIRRTGAYGAPAPEAAPLLAGDDMPVALGRLKLDMVREARCAFGPAAARALWNAVGLPTLYADKEAKGPVIRAEGSGVLALDRILAAAHGDKTVRARLAAALDGDEAEREILRALGVHCRERDDGVAFASSTPFMRAIFAGQPHPALLLRLIPGARDMAARSFGAVRSRAVLIPTSLIVGMLHVNDDEAAA